MIRRSLSVGLALLAVGLFVAAARADDAPPVKPKPKHGSGKFVSYDKDSKKLVIAHRDGEKTFDVAKDVKVVIDGADGDVEALAKLVKGDRITFKYNEDDGKVFEVHKGRKVAPAAPAPSPAPAPAPPPK
jgi:hypothetical protein